MILNVDPATGAVALRNDSPHTIQLDGYNITSASGSLVPGSWNSLDDQNVAGWEEASLTANNLTELKPTSGLLTLTPGTGFSLGNAFETAGATQDLTIGFLQAGNELFTDGTVVYGAFTAPPNPGAGGLTGDYNNNGTVDAADYVLWRNGGPLMNDSTPAGVGPEDYGVWRANFGKTATPGQRRGNGRARAELGVVVVHGIDWIGLVPPAGLISRSCPTVTTWCRTDETTMLG